MNSGLQDGEKTFFPLIEINPLSEDLTANSSTTVSKGAPLQPHGGLGSFFLQETVAENRNTRSNDFFM